MGFEVYVQCFKGEAAGVPREKVRKIFGKQLTEVNEDLWRWGSDDVNSCDLYVSGNGERIESFMVSRPIADAELWDALFEILKLGNVVLHFPGCAAPLVGNKDTIKHMPREMVKALGKPKCVTNGKQISEAIESA